jgi:nicotinamidase-related amidase
MQRVFGEPGSPWLVPRFGEIVKPVRNLVAAFQPDVVFTRFIAPAAPAGAWRRYYEAWPFALQPPGARIYELVDEFAAGAGPTVDSTTFTKWGPELAGRVGPTNELVLAGVTTDCCACRPPRWPRRRGRRGPGVADACAGVDDDSHEKALDILRLYAPLVEVVSLDAVLGG